MAKRKSRKGEKKGAKSRERQKRKSVSREGKGSIRDVLEWDVSQKVKNVRMTSPTFEKPEPLNINTTDEISSSMKQTGNFLSPFESSKGRNKSEKFSKSHTRHRKKSQPRWKSGITKLSKRHNLNKSVLDSLKSKPPTSTENRGMTSHSMHHCRNKSSIGTSGVATPSHKIDKLVRDNIKQK